MQFALLAFTMGVMKWRKRASWTSFIMDSVCIPSLCLDAMTARPVAAWGQEEEEEGIFHRLSEGEASATAD